jgi:transcriptional regulator with XRE-family HTH domain
MTPNMIIRARRRHLGLSDTEVAQEAGLSIYEYGDIEQHADEVAAVTPLHNLRRLCTVLGITLFEIFGIEPPQHGTSASRAELIRRRMSEMGMTDEDLAEKLGYETVVVTALQSDEELLEQYPLKFALDVAQTIEVPIQSLLMPG